MIEELDRARAAPASAWHGLLERLRHGSELAALLENPSDPQMRAELEKLMLMTLSQGYPMIFHSDPDHPDLVPFLNATFNSMGPNPDNVYLISAIRGEGVYRLYGNRGSVHFCVVTIGASAGKGRGIWMEDSPGACVGQTDLDAIECAPDGSFEILISRERPAGYRGNWLELDPRADHLLVRQVSYDWDNEEDAFVALDRIDTPVGLPFMTKEKIENNMRLLGNFVLNGAKFWLDFMNKLRGEAPRNTLKITHNWDSGGLGKQVYIDGFWEIAEDEGLLIETELPETARYWNFQLADALFCGIDLTNRQSSINGRQAHVDADGKFRAVISARDPGIANWLDTGGFPQGCVVGRWLEASSSPTPEMRKVKLAELDALLPADTPRVTPDERQAVMRRRRAAVQRHRRW